MGLVLHCLAALALLVVPATAPAQVPAGSVDYSKDSNWLCLPGRQDICAQPLATTALNANGYGSTGRSSVAANPPLDCFYVYPTVSRDEGLNSDLIPGDGEEKYAAQNQLARFASVCRPFAPMYRSMTVATIAVAVTGGDIAAPSMIAYRDIAAAWRQFVAQRREGRRFVLIGHSQGSAMLQQLIRREIEGKPIARDMALAIIPGFDTLVPQGRLVGGSFRSTPLCSRAGETGCVLTWTSYRERNVPPEGAMFGYANSPGTTVGCTNPGRLGATGWVTLDSYWHARSSVPVPGGPIAWSSEGAPPTPFLRTDGLVSAKCVNDGPRGYLSIRTNPSPSGKRTDRIGGEVGALGFFLPGWGMHLNDIAEAQGDLLRLVEDIGTARR